MRASFLQPGTVVGVASGSIEIVDRDNRRRRRRTSYPAIVSGLHRLKCRSRSCTRVFQRDYQRNRIFSAAQQCQWVWRDMRLQEGCGLVANGCGPVTSRSDLKPLAWDLDEGCSCDDGVGGFHPVMCVPLVWPSLVTFGGT